MSANTVAFVIVFVAAVILFGWSCYQRFRLVTLGQAENRFNAIGRRIWNTLLYTIGQRCAIDRGYRFGINHAILFWSFLLLLIANAEFLLHGLAPDHFSLAKLPNGAHYTLAFVFDLASILALLAVCAAVIRRLAFPPKYMVARSRDAFIILGLIASLMVAFFGTHASEIAHGIEEAESYMPISSFVASTFMSGASAGTLTWLANFFWWVHAFVLLSFLNYLPYSKHMHVLAAIPNLFFMSLEKVTTTQPAETLGVGKVSDLSWKDLFDSYACTECGRCQDKCPASVTDGKPLSPRSVIHDIKVNLLKNGPLLMKKEEAVLPLIGESDEGTISEDAIWACTTCGACREVCPVFIEHVPKLVGMRRYLVKNGLAPENLTKLITTIGETHNMAGKPNEQRANWVSRLKLPYDLREKRTAEVVYFVGCVSSFFPTAQPAARSLAQLMEAAGLDFGIVGGDEWCCGFPLMVAGETEAAASCIRHNVERMKDMGAKTVVMTCPGCYRVWKEEYEKLTGERHSFEVLHAVELLARLTEEGRLGVQGFEGMVTYHDPCDLGRNSGIFDEPRYIIGKIPGLNLVELEDNREYCSCCGSGGDLLASNQDLSMSIAKQKVGEILNTGVQTVVTACPSCIRAIHMAKTAEKVKLDVLDVTELLWKAMGN
ncbi:MAG: (Fe-S)-binding protein [Dehalococcoidia bacterium]|nr:MAG: (Fe-S)-binding protein [Dehalococcoidia bacterium]